MANEETMEIGDDQTHFKDNDDMMPLMEQITDDGSDDDDSINWIEIVPLAVCLCIFLAILIYVCADFSGAMKLVNELIEYTKEHPYEAIGVIVAFYTLMIIFILPITHINILVAYAYCKVY